GFRTGFRLLLLGGGRSDYRTRIRQPAQQGAGREQRRGGQKHSRSHGALPAKSRGEDLFWEVPTAILSRTRSDGTADQRRIWGSNRERPFRPGDRPPSAKASPRLPRPGRRDYLFPPPASSKCSSTLSRLKLPGFCRGGNSL